MTKKTLNLIYRVLHIFTYHPWLKLISLILAVIAWFYIREAMFMGQ